MTESGRRNAMIPLLACIVLLIALINPIAGNMMGQGGMMGKMIGQCMSKDCDTMMNACPNNMTCMMSQSMMGTCPANKTCMMLENLTGPCPANRTCYNIEAQKPATGS